MKRFDLIRGIIAAAALPAVLAGCGPGGYSPGSLVAAAARKEISLEPAKSHTADFPRIVGDFLGG